jgi:hypothetical protein
MTHAPAARLPSCSRGQSGPQGHVPLAKPPRRTSRVGSHESIPTERRVESFADDLNTRRGIVSGRVALLPRSTEIQPFVASIRPSQTLQHLFQSSLVLFPRLSMYQLPHGPWDSFPKSRPVVAYRKSEPPDAISPITCVAFLRSVACQVHLSSAKGTPDSVSLLHESMVSHGCKTMRALSICSAAT